MRYQYIAIDAQGQEISGILTADTEREAARQLQKRGLTAVSLRPVGAVNSRKVASGRVAQRDIFVALHELATLLESEVSLINAIESLAQSSHPAPITQSFAAMALELRQGIAFSKTLQKTTFALPSYFLQLVEAGELTGKVATALRDGVSQMEYEAKIQSDFRNALIYPTILVISGIVAITLIFVWVVPRFANLLQQNQSAEIPLMAQWVLNTGVFLNQHIELIASFAVGVIVILAYIAQQPLLRAKAKDVFLRLPLLGSWLLEAETARWSAMMGTLLENRVPLLRALELAEHCVQASSLRARLSQVSKAVRAGAHLSQALQDHDALNHTGHNLIRAGEQAGQLPKMLNSLAKLLEESGRVRMKRFLLLIEPLAILIIGGVIGVIIIGIILAITSVNKINF